MSSITILTPTYNRANTLPKCYESLCNQTNQNFKWLIIDDGSIDNTFDVIKGFIDSKAIDLEYIYKNNGGKHTAVNEGVKHIETELILILDSDDYLLPNAIEEINYIAENFGNEQNICGLTLLKSYPNGELMGNEFPNEGRYNYIDYRVNGTVIGEHCDVFYTNILKNFPFTEYEGEKYIGESTAWIKMASEYNMIGVNKVIYVADYLDGGLTKSGKKMRISNPMGGMEYARMCMTKEFTLKRRIKSGILYNSYGTIAGDNAIKRIRYSTPKLLTLLTYPLGFLLSVYWMSKYKVRRG